MPTDKNVVEEHKRHAKVVFDDSMKGKSIDAIDKKAGIDFKDEGRVTIPSSSLNMMCPGQKVPSKRYKKRYEEMSWMCDDCGEMHPKGVDCE
jgi:RNase P subunit RPR2